MKSFKTYLNKWLYTILSSELRFSQLLLNFSQEETVAKK